MISKNKWQTYIQKLATIDAKAAGMIREYIDTNGLENSQELIEYAYGIVTKYGEASAELSCEMYDMMAESQGAVVPPAEPADTATIDEVARGVQWGKYHSPNQIPSIVGRQTRQAGADTMIKNAIRDQVEWAWVPSGDTCAFCITLASRGWQRASKKVLKGDHAEHIHANCDCTFGIAFNEKGKQEYDYIYDPQKYADMYYGADGRTPTDKINSIRRARYQQNKDYINAQKRDNYAANLVHSMKKKSHTEWGGKPTLHTEKQITELSEFAKYHNIVLDSSFRSFDGDTTLVEDFIKTVDSNVNAESHMRKKAIRISVSYSMDDEVYAETKGATIIINGYAYRDKSLLMKDYSAKVNEKWFTQGSTYLDIATHESGHVLVYMNQLKKERIREVIFGKDKIKSDFTILERISEYASKNNDELIAESYVAYKNGSTDEYVLKVLKYCGILR